MNIKVADEVWVATALLHRENPTREDFSISEIVRRAEREGLHPKHRPGVQVHASLHCVANKAPNPARHRMLVETRPRRRRLFRPGDPVDEGRRSGKVRPDSQDLPERYRYLIDWYDSDFSHNGRGGGSRAGKSSAVSALMADFAGRVTPADLGLMSAAADECERINPDEW